MAWKIIRRPIRAKRMLANWPGRLLAAGAVLGSTGFAAAVALPFDGQGASRLFARESYPLRIAIPMAGHGAYPVRIGLSSSQLPSERKLASFGLFRFEFSEPVIDEDAQDAAAGEAEQPKEQSGQSSPAFDDAASDRPEPSAAAIRKIGELDVLAVNFDLGGDRPSGKAVEVSKPLIVDGKDAGRAVIRIEGERSIYLRSDAVNTLLARIASSPRSRKVEALSERDAFVSWARLRETGMELRYDPVRDRILVESRSS